MSLLSSHRVMAQAIGCVTLLIVVSSCGQLDAAGQKVSGARPEVVTLTYGRAPGDPRWKEVSPGYWRMDVGTVVHTYAQNASGLKTMLTETRRRLDVSRSRAESSPPNSLARSDADSYSAFLERRIERLGELLEAEATGVGPLESRTVGACSLNATASATSSASGAKAYAWTSCSDNSSTWSQAFARFGIGYTDEQTRQAPGYSDAYAGGYVPAGVTPDCYSEAWSNSLGSQNTSCS